jgi:hypothetical protein
MGFYIFSSSMNNIFGVMIKLSLPCVVICIVSPTGDPSLTSISFSFFCCFDLILNCSSVVFTSCTYSKIESRWFSTFSHTSDSRSYTFMAINSMSFFVSDISICIPWAFAFFLEPLACSTVHFLWASGCSYAFGICLSMPISCSTSSSMATSCAFVFISSALTYPVGPFGACSVACGDCVGPRCEFFCVLVFL